MSGCSAVGSALGSGPRGRWFKSSHPDFFLTMKIFIIILLIPILAFSYETYKVHDISVAYQRSDMLYDYVSLMIDKGYVNSQDCASLKLIAEYVKEPSIEANIKCYPDYTVMEFYSKSMDAVNVLLRIRRSLDEISGGLTYQDYDLLDIAIMERYGYSIKDYPSDDKETIKEKISNAKISLFIKSSADKKELNGIIDKLDISPSYSQSVKKRGKLNGEYYLGNIPSDIFFYDFQGLKDYNLHMYLVLLYSMNLSAGNADIRSVGSDIFFVSIKDAAKGVNEEAFKEAKKLFENDLEIAGNNLSELVYKLNFLFHKNGKFEFSGIGRRISELKYDDFEKFTLSLKPALIFRRGYPTGEETKFEAIALKNGITLLYREKKESGSEIAVAFTDILNIEEKYSKSLSSSIIFADVQRRFSNWKSEIAIPVSNVRIFSLKSSDSGIIGNITDFLVNSYKIDMNNIRDKRVTDEILNAVEYINTVVGGDAKIDSSFLLLSDGEYRMTANKLFSGQNIIISVETSVDKQKIADALESVSLNKYAKEAEAFVVPPESDEKYIEYAFNMRNKYLTADKSIVTLMDIPISFEDMKNPYYKFANNNKTNILAVISYILYSDAGRLIGKLK